MNSEFLDDSEHILEQRMNLEELSQILRSLCTHREVIQKPETENPSENKAGNDGHFR